MKTRKGFTLVELLIVMGIMGILGAMVMIGGQQASDAARGTAIADSLEKAAAAMEAYYIDNAATINAKGTTAEKVAKGTSAYLSETLVDASSSIAEGKYGVVLTEANNANAKWYLVYKLVANEAGTGRKVKEILASKADRMKLKMIPTTENSTIADATDYDGTTDTVYMLVR